MALTKFWIYAVLIIALISMAELARASEHSDKKSKLMSTYECGGKCHHRCSKASRAKMCHHNCMTCCKTCHCVPPGTAGNREACPCYANLKNSKGTGKCP